MKSRTIKTVFRKKVNEWFETIDDPKVKELAEKNTMIVGGAITSLLLGEKVNDFDVYFRTREAAKAVAEYYVGKFQIERQDASIEVVDPWRVDIHEERRFGIMIRSAGVASENETIPDYQYFEADSDPDAQAASEYVEGVAKVLEDEENGDKPKYRPIFLSTNAITLSNKIQLVVRFWGEPEKILKNYDFVHVTNYWTSWDNELVLNADALQTILAKELRYIGSRYPICSVIRLRKFISRGWTINAGQILKMAMQISELDLTNLDVLEDQLTGVDVAYFMEIIEKLRSEDPKKVNNAYLLEIIDRMF